jgi:hypothetical protein
MLEGWYFMTAVLLVLSGGSKVRDPEPTRGALRAAGLPSSRRLVLALSGGEIAVGSAAVGLVSPLIPALVAVLYLGFAAFVAYALIRRMPIQSCGCFGRSDTPPGWLHVGVNLSAVATALVVAGRGGADLVGMLSDQPGAGLPYLGFIAIGAFLLALVLAELPAVLAGRHA